MIQNPSSSMAPMALKYHFVVGQDKKNFNISFFFFSISFWFSVSISTSLFLTICYTHYWPNSLGCFIIVNSNVEKEFINSSRRDEPNKISNEWKRKYKQLVNGFSKDGVHWLAPTYLHIKMMKEKIQRSKKTMNLRT